MSEQITVTQADDGMDAVTAWLGKAHGAEYGFFLAVYQALGHFSHGNRDPLAKLLTVCNGKKAKRIRDRDGQKLMFAAPLKRILQHALAGVSAKADASKDFGIVWTVPANAGVNHDKAELVKALAQGGESPRGKKFREEFPPIVKTVKAPKPAIEQVKKDIAKDDFPVELAKRMKAVMDAWEAEQAGM